jgi:hypothetical protein
MVATLALRSRAAHLAIMKNVRIRDQSQAHLNVCDDYFRMVTAIATRASHCMLRTVSAEAMNSGLVGVVALMSIMAL